MNVKTFLRVGGRGLLVLAGLLTAYVVYAAFRGLTPGVWLHERTHALVGRWVGATVTLEESSLGGRVVLSWSADVARWRIRVAHLAPTLSGLAAAVLGFPLLGVFDLGGWLASTHGLLAAVYVSVQWWLYSWPSAADRQPFLDC